MAVAYDTVSSVSGGGLSWTHTPVGTPKGVLVFVMELGTSDDVSTGVIYGGDAMAAVPGGFAQDTAGEVCSCKAWFLGSGIPAGAQTVAITAPGALVLSAVAITVTAGANTELGQVVLLQGDGTLAEQSVSDYLVAINSMRFAAIASGLASPPDAGANSTRIYSNDDGVMGTAVVRETTAGVGARNVGFDSAISDDRAAVHLSVREVYVVPAIPPDPGGRASRLRRFKPLLSM